MPGDSTPEERHDVRATQDSGSPPPKVDQLPDKLLAELSAAQEWLRTQPDEAAAEAKPAPVAIGPSRTENQSRRLGLEDIALRAGALSRAPVFSFMAYARQFGRRLGRRDWQRRYLVLLSLVHKHIFDRSIERLLFFKSTYPLQFAGALDGTRKSFLYQGPLPAKVLDWCLSALPGDLRRFAFVDFHAGNGRSLLLVTRRNFEHATGYAFDAATCEILEMNLAQYSRSYMSCRDVRALRAGRDGLTIPAQPAVFLFPDGIPASHVAVILDHISQSLSANPRPVYLIFENSGTEHNLDGMRHFEKVQLALLNRVKTALFSPVPVSVYRSAGTADSGHGASRNK